MGIKKPRLYLITAVHNNLHYTKKFLKNIERQSFPPDKIILVDDGSTDGTEKYIKENYPQVKIITGDGNLWWTKSLFLATDYILRQASANDFVLTINTDCFFSKNYLEKIYKEGIKNPKSIVGSLVMDSQNHEKVWDPGIKIDWQKSIFKKVKLPKEKNKTTHSLSDTLSTKGTLFPVEVFKKIGNFNYQRLPHYLSDYEFSCRAKKAGYPLLISYEAKLYTDTKNTGIGDFIPDKISFKQGKDLILSRRSKVNIIDNFNFIDLCCPPKYKLKNYLNLLNKILKNFFQKII